MKIIRFLVPVLALGLLAVSCSHDENIVVPKDSKPVGQLNKNGTETLGPPSIDILDGSGFAVGGVGMVGADGGPMDITVDIPAGANVVQAILYWGGGSTSVDGGDNTLTLNTNIDIEGDHIGGEPPTNFFENYYFTSYRYDITSLITWNEGPNTFSVEGMDFDYSGGTLDENDGVGVLVIYNDGSSADLEVVDGQDLAFFQFSAPLDATVPQTFSFPAESGDRVAQLPIFAGSVGLNRPNQIIVETNGPNGGVQPFDNPLGSNSGELWDAIMLAVNIPAEATELTVQLISTPTTDPLGASMSWIAGGLAVPETPPPPRYCIGDFVWYDENGNGCQDVDEMGVEGVEVHLWSGCPPVEDIGTTYTNSEGYYEFCELLPGDYTVQFVAPGDYYFCHPFSDECNSAFDSNAGEDGFTDCVTIVDADDMTIDAALCLPVPAEACRVTGGCRDTYETDAGTEVYSGSGQAGAPTADQPQPWGEWTHTQRQGPSGSFTFHAGTASAPPGTEIDWIECMDPGWCVQARWAPAKQIDFAGVGTFKNMRNNVPSSISDYVTLHESLHWFEVNVDDLGEPGRAGKVDPPSEICDPLGFGLNSDTQDADCECPDFYRIRIYTGPDDSYDIMYEVYGYIDRGNFQIHPEIH